MFKGEKIQAFTAEQVCNLTGITPRQLIYWDKTDFFNPRFTTARKHTPYRRVYSFRDVVGLRTIARLRNDDHVSLQELRKVGEFLKNNFNQPWASLRFILGPDRKVYFQEPGAKHAFQAHEHGQSDYLVVELEDIAQEVDGRIIQFNRPRGKVSKNRYIVRNDSVVSGTRIRTEAIWNYYLAGHKTDQIINEFPSLSRSDVRAAIRYERGRTKNSAA